MITITHAFLDVLAERERQNVKWGEQNHPDGTGPNVALPGIFTGTFRRMRCIAQDQTDHAARIGTLTYLDVLLEEVMEAAAEADPAALRAELVQVAAVAVAWVEAIDRRHP